MEFLNESASKRQPKQTEVFGRKGVGGLGEPGGGY